jgi:hypothetical protein
MTTALEKAARTWLRGQPGHGRNTFAPFTGQDQRAFSAFVYALELYAGSDEQGRACALLAMRAAVLAAQLKCRNHFRDVIPCVLDWSDVETLWPLVSDPIRRSSTPAACIVSTRRELAVISGLAGSANYDALPLDRLRELREELLDASRAAQSIDDLGSPALNDAAWARAKELTRRLDAIDMALEKAKAIQ